MNRRRFLAQPGALAAVKRALTRWIPTPEAPDTPGKDAYEFDFEGYERSAR